VAAVSVEQETILRDAIARAQEAVRTAPENPMAHYILGAAFRAELLYFVNRGLDTREGLDRAITAYAEAIRLEPTFLWALNELCSSYSFRAHNEIWRGLDP
jgi:eukaryotic-like serine/threonine-protein kinase